MRRTIISKHIGFTLDGVSFKNVVVREQSPIDEFYFEKTKSSDDGKECISFTDPIRMLFNQQRLSRLGSTAVQAWLDSLAQHKNDSLAEIRAKCSDEDLISLIKSRHIQHPCEIMAYLEECNRNMETFSNEVQKLVAARQAEEQTKVENNTNVEPSQSE